MSKVKVSNSNVAPKLRPATNPDARENQMAALAMDLVEQRLRDGTASSQETTHFLKLVSSKARLEQERLKLENELVAAKTKALANAEEIKVLYEEALDPDVMDGAIAAIRQADLLIIGGTSLVVYPAAGLVNYYRGSRLVLINRDPTAMDASADLTINAPIGEVFSQIEVTSCPSN